MNLAIIEYDTRAHDFRTWASSVLGFESLENIHERADLKIYSNVIAQINACRSELNKGFRYCKPIYMDFIQSIIAPRYHGINSYQIPPSFCLHFSGEGSSPFHRDRDCRINSAYLNVWIPLTRVWGANSIWIESEDGTADFSPVELEYGQALIFDGPHLCHGSVLNDTPSTRVSMDFRFAPCRVRE
jgi:hypothetical protein